ncbi:MAG: imidazolonepropionase, partial [Candidatus Aminicenantes bacterium]|nr:imidazolonepropionase [Candidatus Aminicenantes bacterium]
MILADLVVARCSQLLTCRGSIPKREGALQDLGIIEGGSIASKEGKIVFIGKENELHQNVRLDEGGIQMDGRGLVALPGF